MGTQARTGCSPARPKMPAAHSGTLARGLQREASPADLTWIATLPPWARACCWSSTKPAFRRHGQCEAGRGGPAVDHHDGVRDRDARNEGVCSLLSGAQVTTPPGTTAQL